MPLHRTLGPLAILTMLAFSVSASADEAMTATLVEQTVIVRIWRPMSA